MKETSTAYPAHLSTAIRAIELKTRRIVESTFTGGYHSAFKGHGITAAEVRPYHYGDDIRFIDWNVTAKTGVPHIKLFEEDRELTVILMVDVSASGYFGSGSQSKISLALELASVLGFSAVNNQDRVGMMLFSDRVEQYIPPARGRRHMFRLLQELYCCSPEGKKTSISAAVTPFSSLFRRKAMVVLISDFMDMSCERALRVLSNRHDLLPIVIEDKRECELPRAGILELTDAESSETVMLNTFSKDIRDRFRNIGMARRIRLERMFLTMGVRSVHVRTDESYVPSLRAYFNSRGR